VGYAPAAHRRFLVDYYTGEYASSPARGRPFGRNEKTGDARISGELASLAGLETALESGDELAIQRSIDQILLLHSLIMAFGGIPLLYYGDELGTLNNEDFVNDSAKAQDNRWLHRPIYDWERAELRHQRGSVEQRIFDGLKRLISVRKSLMAMADYNNRELIEVGNPHLFVFIRTNPAVTTESILVISNFNEHPEQFNLAELRNRGRFELGELRDEISGAAPDRYEEQLVIPAFGCYWLSSR
jgi:amylosucrase